MDSSVAQGVKKRSRLKLKIETDNLAHLLSGNKKELDRLVLDFLPRIHESPAISSLYEMMREYPRRGGKGVRGSMCLLWCELFGGRRKDALVTAAALELFQNWILIHDDIEDESDLRRGLPALHKKYGISLSINAGDALHGKMWELLVYNKHLLGAELSLKILSEFSTMLNETTEGQQMELSWTTHAKWDITEKDYLLMVTKKAAWYTCISPSRMGVTLASAAWGQRDYENLLTRLIRLGTDLGIAFQIVDDVLNLTAEPKKYGKEILGDLFEGKRTLMLIHLLDHCSNLERSRVIAALSKPRQKKSRNEALKVFELMKRYSSIEYAKAAAR
ncbi:MAG: polyprenyl synthetase family protein, partial [Nitrososphaerales archaeon]